MKVFFLIIFTISNTYQSCLPSSDLLQSGLHDFVIKSFDQNTAHSFPTQLQYDSTNKHIDIALSTSSIGGYIPLGFSYSLRAQKQQDTNTMNIRLFIQNDYRWSFIQVSYLFSSREDFQMENFEASISIWSFKEKNTYLVQVPTLQRNLPSLNYKAISFISGLQTQGKFFSAFVKSTLHNQENKIITIEFEPKSDPQFERISFTYIIYPQQHQIFDIIVQDVQDSHYKFSGSIEFAGSDIKYESLSINRNFLNCTGDLCEGNCILKKQCENLNGEIRKSICLLCKNTGQDGKCLQDIQCGQNQIWSPQQQKCICSQNSYEYEGVCRKCPEGTKVKKSQNSCACSFFSQIFQVQQNRCVQCAKNSWPNSDKTQCLCIQGYNRFNGECRKCPTSSFFNRDDKKCECIFSNSYLDLQQYACKKCPLYSIVNNDETQCVCREGYEKVNGQCQEIRQCPENSELKEGGCECNSGYYQKDQGCEKIPRCPIDSTWNAEKEQCQCNSERAIIISGLRICINCASNQKPNEDKTECICKKGFSKTSSIFCTRILCSLNEQVSDDNECVCRNGLKRNIFNRCQEVQECPELTKYNEELKRCECLDDNYIYFNQSKSCLQCPPNSSPNELKIICVCNFGFQLSQSKCESICKDNAQLNAQTSECECLGEGQIYVNQKCVSCSKNQIWDGSQCVCVEDYNLVEGECKKCSKYSAYNGTHCECQKGFFSLTKSICFPCHRSCNHCTGPKVNECTQCKEENANLVDGICEIQITCPQKYYQKNNKCSRCSQSCLICSQFSNCFRCDEGFEVAENELGQTYCRDICGDGRHFQVLCDDGNTQNGDGCDQSCKIQQGWQCSFPIRGQRSQCQQVQVQGKLEILENKALQYKRKIFYTFTIANLPQCALDLKRSQIFKVQVINTPIVPRIRTNFDPQSPCQLLVELDFVQNFPSTVVEFRVTLNEQFSDCLNGINGDQSIVRFDPATLSIFDDAQELTLEEIGLPIKSQVPVQLEEEQSQQESQPIIEEPKIEQLRIIQTQKPVPQQPVPLQPVPLQPVPSQSKSLKPVPIKSIGEQLQVIGQQVVALKKFEPDDRDKIVLPRGIQKVLKCRFVKSIP